MFNRRDFLKAAAATGGSMAMNPIQALASREQTSSGFFGVNSFIENNPDAVFIMRTNVEDYMDGDAKVKAGLDFSRSVIVPRDNGVPLSNIIPIKPNMRYEHGWNYSGSAQKTTASRVSGYKGTDAYFVEGVINGMKELGMSSEQFFIRECNMTSDGRGSGDYPGVAERTGAEVRTMADKVGVISENDLVWVDTPDGTWYRKIPYLWPINADDTWLLNIAKFKAHSMGLTLCAKNLQGSIAKNYQAHCVAYTGRMDMDYVNHKNPTALTDIKNNFQRHAADGYPRWDRPGDNTWNSGIGMETWASRCLDNNAATPSGLHIIEGIYGVDGHFLNGPHNKTTGALELNEKKGESWEFLTNYIIFGMNAFHVDSVGHWLGGHEPGNIGIHHMAIEKGMASLVNPMEIPLYEWKDDQAVMTPLSNFERTDLLTYSMQRDYLEGDPLEEYWHLMNESYDYGPTSVADPNTQPEAFVLSQNRPNPFNPYTSIEFNIPTAGNVRLEVFNASGQLVDIIVNGHMSRGSHMAVWNTNNHSSGVYFYRFRHGGVTDTKKMTLLK